MKNRVVVFGCSGSIYTKMICFCLDGRKIEYDLICQSSKQAQQGGVGIYYRLGKLLSSGAFKGISIFSPFILYLLFERYRAKKNSKISRIQNFYKSINIDPDFVVENINSDECIGYLESKRYDYALFGGVGIVSEAVINCIQKFCINAHPAPLPECRGGGALECTLYKKLNPAVSVHIATPGIDEGKIIRVSELEMKNPDDLEFQYISIRLTEKCAIELASVTGDLIDEVSLEFHDNDGSLNYWKDWSSVKQIKSRMYLRKLRKELVV